MGVKTTALAALTDPNATADCMMVVDGGTTSKKMNLGYVFTIDWRTYLSEVTEPVASEDYVLISDNGTAKKALLSSIFSTDHGNYNSFFGQYAGHSNTTGTSNSFFGLSAGHSNTTGIHNSFFGLSAGHSNTEGNYNSFFGLSAGSNNTTGNYNTCIGYNAQPSAADVSNEITLGDANVTTLRCKVTSITGISDERDKANIAPITHGLDFIRELKPRSWDWSIRDLTDETAPPTEAGSDIGFVAQELDALQSAYGVDLGLVQKNNPDRWETTPGRLIPILVNAIQEMADEIDMLKEKLT